MKNKTLFLLPGICLATIFSSCGLFGGSDKTDSPQERGNAVRGNAAADSSYTDYLAEINSAIDDLGDTFKSIIDDAFDDTYDDIKNTTKRDARDDVNDGDYSLVTPSFKKTMDSYEAFYDSYISFMKKYNQSNDVMSMYQDYLDMLKNEIDWADKISQIDETKLSIADDAYYLLITTRVEKKLLDASAFIYANP